MLPNMGILALLVATSEEAQEIEEEVDEVQIECKRPEERSLLGELYIVLGLVGQELYLLCIIGS